VENLESFQRGLNRTLPNDLQVLAVVEIVDENFQVRRTKQKVYRYIFDDGDYDVFTQRYVTFSQVKIDEQKLEELLQHFVGTFDFSAFSGLSQSERTMIETHRTINQIQVERKGSRVIVEITGPSFLRYEIRMIIGYCYFMLTHPEKFQPSQLNMLLKQPGELKPGYLAAPNGLTLISISY
jgi:tRNA pseudouridine38-40 synthase